MHADKSGQTHTQAENILFLFDCHQLPFWRSDRLLKYNFRSGFIQLMWMCVQAENNLYKGVLYDAFFILIIGSVMYVQCIEKRTYSPGRKEHVFFIITEDLLLFQQCMPI